MPGMLRRTQCWAATFSNDEAAYCNRDRNFCETAHNIENLKQAPNV